ncbi:MAG: MATE family efflux transporter [Burkholderiaceae bacterium]
MIHSHRRILAIAAPIILSNLSVPLVGLVDTAVMGRLPDPAYLGAVALGATIFSFLYWGFGFLRMGTTGLIAQAAGRRDGAAVRQLVLNNLALAGALAAIVLLMQWPLGRLAAALLPADPVIESAMLDYYRIRVWSAPAVLANYVLMGVFIGLQRTGLALAVQLLLNLTNAALSVLFVIGMGAGIAGVAAASLIAEYLAIGAALMLLPLALRSLPGRWQPSVLGEIARYRALLNINGDIFLRTLCLIFAFGWFNARSAALGEINLAVNAVLLQLVHVLAYGLDGFAHAAETLVGHALGAGRRDTYRWAVRASSLWAGLTAALYSIVYLLLGEAAIAALTTIPAVREAAAVYLPWLVLIPLVAVWSYQLDGIFVGSLRSREMRNAMLLSLLAFLGVAAVAEPLLANHGLWLSLVIFFVARALTLGDALRRTPPAFDPGSPVQRTADIIKETT